ncbi:ATP-binding protein [Halorubrum aidingense]|nr:ATP-binding protein [Halorubrum aidingense]
MPTESRDFAHGASFIKGARDMGIETLAAIYELVDNSIDADAENIHIHVEENEVDGETYIRIAVEDDGHGISETITAEGTEYDGITYVLAFGDSYARGNDKIGKFGWGLSASATCTSLRTEVYTRTADDDDWRYTYIDLDEMDDSNDTKPPTAVKKDPDHLDLENPDTDTGTVVSFEKCDGTDPKTVRGLVSNLTSEIPRVYRDYLDGAVNITVNGKELEPTDPLFMMESAHNVGELPDKVPRVEEPYHTATVELEEEDGDETYDVEITVVMLDVEAIRSHDEWSSDWMSKQGLIERNQGFSVVRNGREIRNGLTLGGIYNKHGSKNYVRAEIRFPSELDDRFGIQTNKSRLSVKQSVKDKVDEALANAPNQIARKTEKIRKQIIAEENKQSSDTDPSPSEKAAEEAARFLKNVREQTAEEQEQTKESVEEQKEEEISEIEADEDLDEDEAEKKKKQVEKKYERQKNSNSHNVTTDTVGTGHFYEAEFRGNQVNAIVNDSHRFYEAYEQLRAGTHRGDPVSTDGGPETDTTQTEESMLIDHLLLAAARAELMMEERHEGLDDEVVSEVLYQYRSEWSEALRGFLKFMGDGSDSGGPSRRN